MTTSTSSSSPYLGQPLQQSCETGLAPLSCPRHRLRHRPRRHQLPELHRITRRSPPRLHLFREQRQYGGSSLASQRAPKDRSLFRLIPIARFPIVPRAMYSSRHLPYNSSFHEVRCRPTFPPAPTLRARRQRKSRPAPLSTPVGTRSLPFCLCSSWSTRRVSNGSSSTDVL